MFHGRRNGGVTNGGVDLVHQGIVRVRMGTMLPPGPQVLGCLVLCRRRLSGQCLVWPSWKAEACNAPCSGQRLWHYIHPALAVGSGPDILGIAWAYESML